VLRIYEKVDICNWNILHTGDRSTFVPSREWHKVTERRSGYNTKIGDAHTVGPSVVISDLTKPGRAIVMATLSPMGSTRRVS
jgi:hypothetical protein